LRYQLAAAKGPVIIEVDVYGDVGGSAAATCQVADVDGGALSDGQSCGGLISIVDISIAAGGGIIQIGEGHVADGGTEGGTHGGAIAGTTASADEEGIGLRPGGGAL